MYIQENVLKKTVSWTKKIYVCTLKGNCIVNENHTLRNYSTDWSITVTATKEQFILQWTHIVISYLHVSCFIDCTCK